MNDNNLVFNTPKNASLFKGEFIVFFSENKEPDILFHSFLAEEAYKKAEEISEKEGRNPVVVRVGENTNNNTAQFLALRV